MSEFNDKFRKYIEEKQILDSYSILVQKLIEEKIPLNVGMRDIIHTMVHRKYVPLYIRDNHDQPFRPISRIPNSCRMGVVVDIVTDLFKNYKTHTVVGWSGASVPLAIMTNMGSSWEYYFNDAERVMIELMSLNQRYDYQYTINKELEELERIRVGRLPLGAY